MQYRENPLALILIPIALLAAGGTAAAIALKRRKKTMAPSGPSEPSYPYASQPTMVPSSSEPPANDPMKQIQQFQDKYGKTAPAAASAAKKAWEILVSPPTSAEKIKEAAKETSEQKAAIDKLALEVKQSGGKLPEGEKIPGIDDPSLETDNEKTAASPASAAAGAKQAATGASAAATGAKVLGVGLGTVALVGAAVAVAVAGFEAYRSQQKQLKKLHADYKLWRAMAVQYVTQTTDTNKHIKAVQGEVDFMKQAIPKMQAALQGA